MGRTLVNGPHGWGSPARPPAFEPYPVVLFTPRLTSPIFLGTYLRERKVGRTYRFCLEKVPLTERILRQVLNGS
jgi:hypothetical protein